MYHIGTPGIKQKKLVDVTYEAMMRGIEIVAPVFVLVMLDMLYNLMLRVMDILLLGIIVDMV